MAAAHSFRSVSADTERLRVNRHEPGASLGWEPIAAEPESHAVIRRAYQAFATRDVDGLRELSDPGVELRTVTGALAREGEPYVGLDGLLAYMRDVGDVWDELELLPAEFHDLGDDRTLVFGRVRARRGSTLIDSPNAWLWRVREGKVVAAEVFGDPEAATALLGEN